MKLKRCACLAASSFSGRIFSRQLMQLREYSIVEDKRFIFVRHGITEMNERLQVMPWYSENFVDGALWDTRLSSAGVQQAKELHQNLARGIDEDIKLPDVEVLLASPLTRTLHTAELVFYDQVNLLPDVPKIAHPLLRERLYLSSEVGRCSSELSEEYTEWDFTALTPGKPWWYVHYMPDTGSLDQAGSSTAFDRDPRVHLMWSRSRASNNQLLQQSAQYLPSEVSHQHAHYHGRSEYSPYVEWRPEGRYCCEGEPKHIFTHRIGQLREYLLNRPERCLAIVTHWGVLKALTGREFKNCEVQVVRGSELLLEPDVSDE